MTQKEALLIKGEPLIIDDVEKFIEDTKRDVKIVSEIAFENNYNVQPVSLKNTNSQTLIKKITSLSDADDFLFYYTGHSNKKYISSFEYKTSEIMDAIGKISGRKIVVFDSCSGDYSPGEEFSGLSLPSKCKVIGAKEIYPSKSLSKLIHDAVISRGINLRDLDKKTFDDMKHNWVYFREMD